MLFLLAIWYICIDFTRIGEYLILNDVIIHGLTACIAFILQVVIFKVTRKRPLRYWVLILAGLAIFASSYFGFFYPWSGLIALVLFLANKSYKNLRHTILETSFIPFTFALMVRLVIFLIIPIFFPSVPDYYFAGPLYSCLLFCYGLLKVPFLRCTTLEWCKLIKRDLGTNQPLSSFVA